MESVGLRSVAVGNCGLSTSSTSTSDTRSALCSFHSDIASGLRTRSPSIYVKVMSKIIYPFPGNCLADSSSSASKCCSSSPGVIHGSGGGLRLRGSRSRLNLKRWPNDPLSCYGARRIFLGPGSSVLCMALNSRHLGRDKWTVDRVPQSSEMEVGHFWNSSLNVAPVLVRISSQNPRLGFVTARKAKPPWISSPRAVRKELPLCDESESIGNVALSFSKSSSSGDEQVDGRAVQRTRAVGAAVPRSFRNATKTPLGLANASLRNATERGKSSPSGAEDSESPNSLHRSPFKHYVWEQAGDHSTVDSEEKQVTSNGKRISAGEEMRTYEVGTVPNSRSTVYGARDHNSLDSTSGNSRPGRSSRSREPSPAVKTSSTRDTSIYGQSTRPTREENSGRLLNSPARARKHVPPGSRRSSSAFLSPTSMPERLNSGAVVSDQISQAASETGRNAKAGTGSSQILSSSESLDRFHRLLEEQSKANGSKMSMQGPMRPEESSRLWDRLKEQKQKSIQQIHRRLSLTRQVENDGQEVSLAIEPDSLILGECVVHKRVGVGKYIGTKSEVPPGKTNPVKYIYLKYADGVAKLPAKQAHRLLYRYHLPGEVGRAPTLSKLKDPSLWEKRKQKGKIAIQRMVVNMMDLHVHRLKQSRPCYPLHRVRMAEFASKFPYRPTPDQIQAFADVERDMTQLDLPMDRLICGDVGFGKTEVALRAILIAVLAGKQVMVLTPSTVLAKQQYQTIRDRFSGFPGVKVALLCRFQKEAARKELIVGIRDGSLSVVVGTHSLLGNQIRYNNLGLLVIDEEQRFGVKQKVKITCLKTSVDVLTLTATPIPRTLYMAMSGFRDTSLLATPPPERRPIKTHLSEYHQERAKRAIQFELDRGGQVFYVVPRVKGIEKLQESLRFQFPDVKMAVAHGKQPASVLEDAMERFCLGETKILLCTNIIESGLDIHMVNTIIVEDVQHFGLAQLYQLRGRVGRADQEAHAYLFHPSRALLSDEASERLNALRDCCELGQGFQLAERDMAIRGFGSLFGEEQSGDAAKIGTDLYFEMLLDGLSKVDSQRVCRVEYDDVHFELGVDTHIPGDYISNSNDRDAVMKIAELAARESLQALMISTNSLREKYGREPPSVEMLLKTLYIRRMAADLGIHRIRTDGPSIRMETGMSKDAFEMISYSITSDSIRSFLAYEKGCIKIEGHLGIPIERQVERIFSCLADMCNGLPSFMKYL